MGNILIQLERELSKAGLEGTLDQPGETKEELSSKEKYMDYLSGVKRFGQKY